MTNKTAKFGSLDNNELGIDSKDLTKALQAMEIAVGAIYTTHEDNPSKAASLILSSLAITASVLINEAPIEEAPKYMELFKKYLDTLSLQQRLSKLS